MSVKTHRHSLLHIDDEAQESTSIQKSVENRAIPKILTSLLVERSPSPNLAVIRLPVGENLDSALRTVPC